MSDAIDTNAPLDKTRFNYLSDADKAALIEAILHANDEPNEQAHDAEEPIDAWRSELWRRVTKGRRL